MFMLYFGCDRTKCVPSVAKAVMLPQMLWDGLTDGHASLWSWGAFAAVSAWTLMHFVLYVLLPGARVPGVKLRDGSQLTYPINGHYAFWLTLAIVVGWRPFPLALLYDHYLELMCEQARLPRGAISQLRMLPSHSCSRSPCNLPAIRAYEARWNATAHAQDGGDGLLVWAVHLLIRLLFSSRGAAGRGRTDRQRRVRLLHWPPAQPSHRLARSEGRLRAASGADRLDAP